jgi:hypothetical protein
MALTSPGVQVDVRNESVYVPGRAATVPLIFITTAAEKLQSDGLTPALGTYESGVLRVVTSTRELLTLYGMPRFLESADGQPHHGDARNEYGLDALAKYLEVGRRAYVIRANVNTNDNFVDIKQLWGRKVAESAEYLKVLAEDAIADYNEANGLYPADPDYKKTLTKDELRSLLVTAMAPTYSLSSFSTPLFYAAFYNNHTIAQPGYQSIDFKDKNGFLTTSDITGLEADKDYASALYITSSVGRMRYVIEGKGSDFLTFGNVVSAISAAIGSAGTVVMAGGKIRVTSSLSGVTSAVEFIPGSGATGAAALFESLYFFAQFGTPVPGAGGTPLVIYDDSFTNITGEYDGLDAMIEDWNAGVPLADQFTPNEAQGLLLNAANDFDNTREFRTYTSLGVNDAQRRARIVQALQAEINSVENGARAEDLEYNLAVSPGFFECSDEIARLNIAMRSEVFGIGDSPFDKPPTGPNSMANWARTPARVTSEYFGYWYGHGLSSNLDGKTIMTTSGSTALRTLAYSDGESDVFFAPAGTTRGTCPHLTDVGYVSGVLGGPTTFVSAPLDEGQRSELYEFPKNINPISFIPGRGILVMGQKTTSPVASSLDRINGSRLVIFMRRQIRKALFPWLFEPNDVQTRRDVKYAIDNFCLTLVNRRALYDFATLVNDTNNTPETIDNNELHATVAIKITKAVEFIYATIRVVRTGDDIGTGRQITVGQ